MGPRYSYQGAVHLSWRDPMTGLFGAFGGMGTSNQRPYHDANLRFVGGEAQFYLDNITLYAQGGYVDFGEQISIDDGFFARGVFRWFPDNTSRLQLEGTYVNADFAYGPGDMDAFSVKARYDFTIAGMPLIGDTPIYVAYRGTFRDSCWTGYQTFGSGGLDVNDHTIMVGTSYSFSGDRLTVDRQGATLDTPDFSYDCFPANEM